MNPVKCMLAGKATDLAKLVYPLYVSHKLDGVRCLIIGGVAYSRSMKPIRSQQVQQAVADGDLDGLDGELIAGPPTARDAYLRTVSAVMGADNEDEELKFYVFDSWDSPKVYKYRIMQVRQRCGNSPFATALPHHMAADPDGVLAFEEAALAAGHEGIMINSVDGLYKHGRSTEREGTLLKLKRFCDGEAMITGYAEKQHNANEATRDVLGRTERSSAKAGKRGTGTLGALMVFDLVTKQQFNIGTGFDDAQRAALWLVRKTLAGRVVKYRYFPTGSKAAPRFPVWLGWRDADDMS